MRLLVTIEMDNAAFENDRAEELVRILRKLATRIRAGDLSIHTEDRTSLLDINGNTCGLAEVKP